MSEQSDVSRSKRLSLVLRHRPELAGVTLDPHGWVDVDQLLTGLADHGHPMSRHDLARVVETNDKQRFEWDVTSDRIRARQGHSVEVELDLEPTPPPDVLYHGTQRTNIGSIRATGLHRGGRHDVHLSPDEATARNVGARRGHPVVLRIDARAMAEAGHEFLLTGNGVWLVHAVPARFIDFPE